MKDSHIPTEVVKVLVNPHKLPRIFYPQQWSKDFSSSAIKDFEYPTAVKDLCSPTAVKDFIISSYQGFIFLSKTANQLTCAYITFIYHKH